MSSLNISMTDISFWIPDGRPKRLFHDWLVI